MDGDDGGFCRDMFVYIWQKFSWNQPKTDLLTKEDDGRKWNSTTFSNASRRSGSFSLVDDRNSQKTSKSQDDLTQLFRCDFLSKVGL